MRPDLPLHEISSLLNRGSHTVSELVDQVLDRVKRIESINAFTRIYDRRAIEQAARLDQLKAQGEPAGPLYGIPLAIKDNINEKGQPCAAGCKAYLDSIPLQDASVVTRLKEAGAIIIGRTNMHELADGVTSEISHFGPVHNPWRRDFHPGGSSGGSAAAIAAGCLPVALGTDTGGSIRIPASLCGVVGFKPSQGLVPADGVVPLSITLDTIGPLARTVKGAATVLSVLVPDKSIEKLGTFDRSSQSTVGVLGGFGLEPDPPVQELFQAALGILEALGCRLTKLTIPYLAKGMQLLSTIYAPEAAYYHKTRLEQNPEGFSRDVRFDLQRGYSLDPVKYNQALDEKSEMAAEIREAVDDLDFLVCPTTPHPSRPLGSPNPSTYLIYTCPFNLTGQPAISVPMGQVDGLPVGLQLIGSRKGDDAKVLMLADAFEQRIGFDLSPPNP